MSTAHEAVMQADVLEFGLGATRGCSVFNLLTMAVSRGAWSHVFPVWRIRPRGLSAEFIVYYEMQFKRGMVGPRKLMRAVEWAARRPWRDMKVWWIPCGAEAAARKLEKNEELRRDCRGYAKGQIVSNLLFEKLGWPIQSDPTLLQCAEHSGILLAEGSPEWDLRTKARGQFDAFTPGFVVDGVVTRLRAGVNRGSC